MLNRNRYIYHVKFQISIYSQVLASLVFLGGEAKESRTRPHQRNEIMATDPLPKKDGPSRKRFRETMVLSDNNKKVYQRILIALTLIITVVIFSIPTVLHFTLQVIANIVIVL